MVDQVLLRFLGLSLMTHTTTQTHMPSVLIAGQLNIGAQLQALLAKCLAEATVELKTAQQVVSTLTDQTAVLNELKTEIQAAVDVQEVTASSNVTSIVVPQLS